MTDTLIKELHDGGSDGVRLGNATSQKFSFGGATPAVVSTMANAAVATTLAVSSYNATSWVFNTSTQANAIVSLVNEIRALLVSLGLAQ
jgi:hypothetical protein